MFPSFLYIPSSQKSPKFPKVSKLPKFPILRTPFPRDFYWVPPVYLWVPFLSFFVFRVCLFTGWSVGDAVILPCGLSFQYAILPVGYLHLISIRFDSCSI